MTNTLIFLLGRLVGRAGNHGQERKDLDGVAAAALLLGKVADVVRDGLRLLDACRQDEHPSA
jgi:hypothetical protein